jgi:hypothetical protein
MFLQKLYHLREMRSRKWEERYIVEWGINRDRALFSGFRLSPECLPVPYFGGTSFFMSSSDFCIPSKLHTGHGAGIFIHALFGRDNLFDGFPGFPPKASGNDELFVVSTTASPYRSLPRCASP